MIKCYAYGACWFASVIYWSDAINEDLKIQNKKHQYEYDMDYCQTDRVNANIQDFMVNQSDINNRILPHAVYLKKSDSN